jgi:hypothetical protein
LAVIYIVLFTLNSQNSTLAGYYDDNALPKELSHVMPKETVNTFNTRHSFTGITIMCLSSYLDGLEYLHQENSRAS